MFTHLLLFVCGGLTIRSLISSTTLQLNLCLRAVLKYKCRPTGLSQVVAFNRGFTVEVSRAGSASNYSRGTSNVSRGHKQRFKRYKQAAFPEVQTTFPEVQATFPEVRLFSVQADPLFSCRAWRAHRIGMWFTRLRVISYFSVSEIIASSDRAFRC